MIGTTMSTPLHGQTQTSLTQTKKSVEFACDLKAMKSAQRKRHSEVLSPALKSAKRNTSELSDGYAFQVRSDAKTFATVSEWVGNERRCCRFFKFDIHVGGKSSPIVLRITGPEGVKQFIKLSFSGMVGCCVQNRSQLCCHLPIPGASGRRRYLAAETNVVRKYGGFVFQSASPNAPSSTASCVSIMPS